MVNAALGRSLFSRASSRASSRSIARLSLALAVVSGAALAAGCGSVGGKVGDGGAGGAPATGGAPGGTGGSPAGTGGSPAGTGGSPAGTGGSPGGTGGSPGGTGGALGTGGAPQSDASGDSSSDAGPGDATVADAPMRCDQPVSAGDCTGLIPRSCQELFSWGARTDGAYKIDPDGAQMNVRDQTGWTLMAKVQTANVDSVDEQRTWFITEGSPSMLTTRTFIDNQPPSSHGAYKFAPLISASSVARFEIYAQLDTTQKGTWYKAVASAGSLQSWFTANDTTASKVCTDLAFTLNCSNGTIAPDGPAGTSATLLNGMNLTPFGYTAGGPIHMRLNDDGTPAASGVCSNTLNNDSNKWKDTYMTHWGNGLLIWLN
jgi:hypothetical protein